MSKAELEGWSPEKVRNIRVSAGMTQADFASALNLSENYIYQVENGRKPLTPKTINAVERFQMRLESGEDREASSMLTGGPGLQVRERAVMYETSGPGSANKALAVVDAMRACLVHGDRTSAREMMPLLNRLIDEEENDDSNQHE